jgi:hypothetical protein
MVKDIFAWTISTRKPPEQRTNTAPTSKVDDFTVANQIKEFALRKSTNLCTYNLKYKETYNATMD